VCVARYRSIMITFDLELDKTEYYAGETAKGKLLASADKDLELVDLNFSVFGAEFISVSGELQKLEVLQRGLIPGSN
jgi:hypothetical protein